ncbi:MAG: hypothetical protein HY908_07400 [Myxococcales bacterium]|nr:hypothetical protein [Myxococcales bacterium]
MPRWLKKAELTILTLGSSVLIAACYGAQYVGQRLVHLLDGRVSDPKGAGVQGIQVCVTTPSEGAERACAPSDATGRFELQGDYQFAQSLRSGGYHLEAADVDGAANGAFATTTTDVPAGAPQSPVNLQLTPAHP